MDISKPEDSRMKRRAGKSPPSLYEPHFTDCSNSYPHEYKKKEIPNFPVGNCRNAKVFEYPVFKTGSWNRDEKRRGRDAGAFRVVYRQDNGAFCGYMVHTQTGPDGRAKGPFVLCRS